MAARDENFLDGGTVDPFTGLAPALTPEEEATQRLLKLRYAAQQTANTNNAPGGYASQRGASDRSAQFHANPSQVIDAYVYGKTDPNGLRISQEEYEAAKALQKGNHDAMNTGAYKALTYGILAAPAAVTGVGAAIGGTAGLGFGAAESSLTGAPAVTTGGASVAPELAAPGAAGAGTPFTMASPFPAAGGAGGAASGGGGGAAGFAKSVGLPALEMLGPLAIQQATGGKTKEQKQLVEAQQQMALEAQRRQGQVQDQRMNMLAQQVLAFNPRNQLLAQMVGPQAAFSPDQAAQMVSLPEPPRDPNILNYAGNDQNILKQKQEMIRRHNEWLQSEQQRREMMTNNFQAPGPGPAPINMPAPQAARRF